MSDDLVKRLRQHYAADYVVHGVCDEAADRIEQLEAALWKIVVREHQAEIVSKLAEELSDIARKALE